MYEYREFHRLENDVPLLESKEDFEMHNCDFPIYCPERMVDMRDIEEHVTFNDVVRFSMYDVEDCLGKEERKEVENNKTVCDMNLHVAIKSSKCVKQFDEIEEAGMAITYRCVDCRVCSNCKKGARFEAVSIQEEIEQNLIERSIHVDVEQGITTEKLPFVTEPDVRLIPNENEA